MNVLYFAYLKLGLRIDKKRKILFLSNPHE